MDLPSWVPTDAKAFLIGLLRKVRTSEIDLACTPHLMTAYSSMSVEAAGGGDAGGAGEAKRYVSIEDHVPWLELFGAVLRDMALPLAMASRPLDPDAEDRFFAAVLFTIEALTRGNPHAIASVDAIAAGTLELSTALRTLEIENLTAALEHANVQLETAAKVDLDPIVVSELARMNRLVAGELVIPIPHAARGVAAATTFQPGENAVVKASFTLRATPAELREIYRVWARRDGWLIEADDHDGDMLHLRLARGARRFDMFAARWIDGEAMLMFHLADSGPAMFELSHAVIEQRAEIAARIAAGPPPVPAFTRPRPKLAPAEQSRPGAPDALAYDRGAVFATHANRLWVIDPTSRTAGHVLARDDDARLSAILIAGDELLLVERQRGEILRVELATGTVSVAVTAMSRPGEIVRISQTAYVVCEASRVCTIDLETMQLAGDLAAGAALDKIEALAVHGDALYAASHRTIVRFDRDQLARPEHAAPTTICELPAMVCGLASTGGELYASMWGGIVRVDVRTGEVRQVAGKEMFGHGYEDGVVEVASLTQPAHLTCDDHGIWFADGGRLRRLDLASRYVSTIGDYRHV